MVEYISCAKCKRKSLNDIILWMVKPFLAHCIGCNGFSIPFCFLWISVWCSLSLAWQFPSMNSITTPYKNLWKTFTKCLFNNNNRKFSRNREKPLYIRPEKRFWVHIAESECWRCYQKSTIYPDTISNAWKSLYSLASHTQKSINVILIHGHMGSTNALWSSIFYIA